MIKGKEYLIDQNNIVYTNDVENPSILGKLDGAGDIVNECGVMVNTH